MPRCFRKFENQSRRETGTTHGKEGTTRSNQNAPADLEKEYPQSRDGLGRLCQDHLELTGCGGNSSHYQIRRLHLQMEECYDDTRA